MAFDLSTAKEVKEKSGFDLSTAKEINPNDIRYGIASGPVLSSAVNAINAMERFTGNLGGAVADYSGLVDKKEIEDFYKRLEENLKAREEWANPGKQKFNTAQNVGGFLATLPLQLLSFPFRAAETGTTMIDKGESLGRSIGGTLLNTAGNVAAVAIPGAIGTTIPTKMVTGAALNPIQDYLIRAGISATAEKPETKKELGPSKQSAITSSILGAVLGPLAPNLPGRKAKELPKPAETRLNDIAPKPKDNTTAQPTTPETVGPVDQLGNTVVEPVPIPVTGEKTSPFTTPRSEVPGINPGSLVADYLLSDRVSPEQRTALVKKVFDPNEPTHNPEIAAGMLEDLKSIDPKMVEELALAHDPAEATKILDDLARKQEVQKMGQMEAMWNERGETMPKRAEERIAREDQYDNLTSLEQDLRSGKPISKSRFGPARGNIDLDLLTLGLSKYLGKNKNQDPNSFVNKLIGGKLYQEPTSAETVIEAAKAEGAKKYANIISSPSQNFNAGASLEGLKRNSTLVTGYSRIVQRAANIEEDLSRTNAFPVETAVRKAGKSGILELARIIKEESANKARLSMEEIANRTGSAKTALAYSQLRKLKDHVINYLKEIDPESSIRAEAAYAGSVWEGDFRRVFSKVDDEGNTKAVWVLGSKTKAGLEAQTKALYDKFPDTKGLTVEDKYIKGNPFGMDSVTIYNKMVDILGSDDPAIAKIKQWVMEEQSALGRKMLGEEKHFIPKTGVRGFIGDRPSNAFDIFKSIKERRLVSKFDEIKEAAAYIQTQIDLAKSAYKWGEMQKAANEVKKIFADKDLAALQPDNMAYIKDHWLQNIGMTNSEFGRIADNLVRKLGASPSSVAETINTLKGLWITQKILSTGYALSNWPFQYLGSLAHIVHLTQTYGGNPLVAMAVGHMAGMAMATGHVIHNFVPKFNDILYQVGHSIGSPDFVLKAMKYAEDNSITTRSIYDEAPVESSYKLSGKIGRLSRVAISSPETVLRAMTFMTYTTLLKTSGKFKNDMDIFRIAEERTNASMGDYRQGERSVIFNKLGKVPNSLLNTLTTYPMNWANQYSWAIRETGRGNPVPLMVMATTGAILAGAYGVPGFKDLNTLMDWTKDLFKNSPKVWAKIKDFDLEQTVYDTLGDVGLAGVPSSLTNMSLTSRAASPTATEQVPTPFAPYIDLAGQGANWLGAAIDPTNPSKWAEAVYGSAPTVLQGPLETGPFRDLASVPVKNPNTGEETRIYKRAGEFSPGAPGVIERTPIDETKRKWGFRSLDEDITKRFEFKARKKEQDVKDVSKEAIKLAYQAARSNNTERAREYIQLYTELTGKPVTDEMLQTQVFNEFTSNATKTTLHANTLEGILAVKRLQQIRDERKQ